MARTLAAARPNEDDLGVASYFEVHVRREARWTIDCTATTAAEALAEAEDIARRTDVMAVKVVNERYNPHTDQSAARVIHKVEKPERKRARGPVRMVAAPRVVPVAKPETAAETGPATPQPARPEPASARAQPAEPSRLPQHAVAGGTSASPAAPWLLFAWASLVLALGASALFVLLLVVG